MKHIIFLFFLLCSFSAFAQYPNAPNKIVLGRQTTGDGLIFRSDSLPNYTPNSNKNAWFHFDTIAKKLYFFEGGTWQEFESGITSIDSSLWATLYALQDTAANIRGDFPVSGTGTVTSISQGVGIIATPNPITTTGTVAADTAGMLVSKTFLSNQGYTANTGTVTSVGTGFGLTGGTITGAGTIVADTSVLASKTYVTTRGYLTAEVDGSIANEGVLGVGAGSGTTSVITSNTSGATGVTITAGTGLSISESTSTNGGTITLTNSAPDQTVSITGAGINVTSGTYPNFTITGTEVDGSVNNEGSLTVGAGTGTTSIINSNTSGSTPVTLQVAGTGLSISESGNTITLTSTPGIDSTLATNGLAMSGDTVIMGGSLTRTTIIDTEGQTWRVTDSTTTWLSSSPNSAYIATAGASAWAQRDTLKLEGTARMTLNAPDIRLPVTVPNDNTLNRVMAIDSLTGEVHYVDKSSIASGTDQNGIFDAANDEDTIRVNTIYIPPTTQGLIMSSADGQTVFQASESIIGFNSINNTGFFAEENVASTSGYVLRVDNDTILIPPISHINDNTLNRLVALDSITGQLKYVDKASIAGGGGSMTSFSLAGTSGTPQTISDGNTATIAAGVGISTTAGATDQVTVAADTATVLVSKSFLTNQGYTANAGTVTGTGTTNTIPLWTSSTALGNSALTESSGNVTATGTGAFRLPNGTTAQRPGTPTAGMMRYNTTNGAMEYQAGTFFEIPIKGATLTGLGTAGRVFYADANGRAAANDELYWDATNKRLGVGTSTPVYDIESIRDVNAFTGFNIQNTSAGTAARIFFSATAGSGSTANYAFMQSFPTSYTAGIWGGTYVAGSSMMGRYGDSGNTNGKLLIVNNTNGAGARAIEFHMQNGSSLSDATMYAKITESEFVINESSFDYDFRVESDGDVNNLFSDGGTNRIGIGNNAPVRKLHVTGEARITDLTTDTPTRIVGADADGDLGQILIGSGLSLSGDTLTATGGGGGIDSTLAANGLTLSGKTVKLGGSLTENTTIAGGAYGLTVTTTDASTSGITTQSPLYGVQATSTGGVSSLLGITRNATTNTVLTNLSLLRQSTGTGASGIGQSIDFVNEADNDVGYRTNRITSLLSNAAVASRTSRFIIGGLNSASEIDQLTIEGTGQLKLNQYGSGTFTGTAAKWLAVTSAGVVIEENAPSGGGGSPSVITPAQITSDQDDYNPTGWSTCTVARLSGDNGMRAVTSFAARSAWTEVKLINVGTFPIYFPGEHPDGTAANRISVHKDIILYPKMTAVIFYDSTSTRWRFLDYPDDRTGRESGKMLEYTWSAGSVTVGDYGDWSPSTINSGTSTALGSSATNFLAATQMSTATATNGGASHYYTKAVGTSGYFSGTHMTFSSTFSIPTLSDTTNNFSVEVQISNGNATSALTPNNTVGVRYNHGINGGKFQGYSKDNAAGESTVDLGVTVAENTVYNVRVEIDKSKTEARFYINGEMAGRVTGNMPNSVVAGGRIYLLKSAGSTARTVLNHSMSHVVIVP